jgi:hypothetical protein
MLGKVQQLFSWRNAREYQRVAESELAHVSGSRAGMSCALVSTLCCMTLRVLKRLVVMSGSGLTRICADVQPAACGPAAVSAGHDLLCMQLSGGKRTQVRDTSRHCQLCVIVMLHLLAAAV